MSLSVTIVSLLRVSDRFFVTIYRRNRGCSIVIDFSEINSDLSAAWTGFCDDLLEILGPSLARIPLSFRLLGLTRFQSSFVRGFVLSFLIFVANVFEECPSANEKFQFKR